MLRQRALALIGFTIALGAAANSSADQRPPNFIIILADDQGYNDLGCFGSKKINTPNIDRMASQGVRFTNFYAQAVCGPSRAALMTGCYPIRIGEPKNKKNQHTILHPQEITLAEILKSRDYATACIGKWHLGPADMRNPRMTPNGQGFDYFYGTPLFNGLSVKVDDHRFRSKLMRNDQVLIERVKSWDHITQDYTREAIEFIRKNKSQPFFLYLAHNMPHIPLGASERFKGNSAYGPYGDAIEEIDWSTGEILNVLSELGIDESTLVIYTSDNGPWFETTRGNRPDTPAFIPPDHSGSADPLRGYKMLTWEGGLRVPCVMRWPGKIAPDGACHQVAATIDLLPTLAKLAKAELPGDRILDGKDIWPLLSQPNEARSPHEAFYFYCYTHLQAVRSDHWKLILPRPQYPRWTGWSGRFFGDGVKQAELYDLSADVSEARDVAQENPQVVARLIKLVNQARDDLGDYDRVGKGARFFDPGEHRPDIYRAPNKNR